MLSESKKMFWIKGSKFDPLKPNALNVLNNSFLDNIALPSTPDMIAIGGQWFSILSRKIAIGGTWRTVGKIQVVVNGVWRTVYASGLIEEEESKQI